MVFDKVKEIIIDQLDVDESAITPDTSSHKGPGGRFSGRGGNHHGHRRRIRNRNSGRRSGKIHEHRRYRQLHRRTDRKQIRASESAGETDKAAQHYSRKKRNRISGGVSRQNILFFISPIYLPCFLKMPRFSFPPVSGCHEKSRTGQASSVRSSRNPS